MSTSSKSAFELMNQYKFNNRHQSVLEKLKKANDSKCRPQIPGPLSWNKSAQIERVELVQDECKSKLDYISGKNKFDSPESLRGNIENYIGMSQIPTGIIGPLRINGAEHKNDYYVPMATSEGALVASYNRGAKAATKSGGITSVCLTESVQRSPVFCFASLLEVGEFMKFVLSISPKFQELASTKSNYAKIKDFRVNMEGNKVILIFDFTTGDAAGQNMVTLCSEAICEYIISTTPISPKSWYIESNYSGDKKATAVSFANVRGKKVIAEATIQKDIVRKVLRSTPEEISEYWLTSSICSIESGSIGIQGHFANGLAAMFIACGQDVACVAESFVGITRMEVSRNGDLYISVTLPSLVVGTVGGGTWLPTQRECLEMLDCYGNGNARRFAEICAATVLCGELSIAAAIASGDFAKAHKLFGRKKER